MLNTLKKNWFLVVIGIAVIVFLFVSNKAEFRKDSSDLTHVVSPVEIGKQDEEIDQGEIKAIVDVKGEVNKPGVYEIESDARINDVIRLAGGFSVDADEVHINLAQKVQDEMTIIVPKHGEVITGTSTSNDGSEKVKINNATQTEIETLSGIGPSKAQAIIQYRDDHGFFTKVEDLLEISGIGEKTLENIQDDIQVP